METNTPQDQLLKPDDPCYCPICQRWQTANDHGVARSRASGRNLYCKECIRVKVADQRQMIRDMKTRRAEARERAVFSGRSQAAEFVELMQEEPCRKLNVLARQSRNQITPEQRMVIAFDAGCRTRELLKRHTSLSYDKVGDILADWIDDSLVEQRRVAPGKYRYYLRRQAAENILKDAPAANQIAVAS